MRIPVEAILLLLAGALCVGLGAFGSPALFHTDRLRPAGRRAASLRLGRLLAIGAGLLFLVFAAITLHGIR